MSIYIFLTLVISSAMFFILVALVASSAFKGYLSLKHKELVLQNPENAVATKIEVERLKKQVKDLETKVKPLLVQRHTQAIFGRG